MFSVKSSGPRSTLEEMLDMFRTNDAQEQESADGKGGETRPPPLPVRPTSRARLPSSVRARRQVNVAKSASSAPVIAAVKEESAADCPVADVAKPDDRVALGRDDDRARPDDGIPAFSTTAAADQTPQNGHVVFEALLTPASNASESKVEQIKPSLIVPDVVSIEKPGETEGESSELDSGNSFGDPVTEANGFADHVEAWPVRPDFAIVIPEQLVFEHMLNVKTPPLSPPSSPPPELSSPTPGKKWKDDGVLRLRKGLRVWCSTSENLWISGVILSVEETDAIVRTSDCQEISVSTSKVQPANPDILEGVDDLTKLSYLNEPSVLHDLQYRYIKDQIYTKAGPVLIAVNPFKKVPIYGEENVLAYQNRTSDSTHPHVYMIADSAFGAMMKGGVNQSVIISGESGAGKTETAKIAMQYLAALGGGGGVEEEILQTNPILEAFGNAKTSRNDNSSRFGKLIDIHFDETGKICGANIQTYLLEKSRVVQQAQGERSYHVFYQLCAGADESLRDRINLRSAKEYRYLNQSNCLSIDNVDDANQFQYLRNAMNVVQICEEEQEQAFELLSAILWLGNITFRVVENENHVAIDANEALEVAGSLLHCKASKLVEALSSRRMRVGGDTIVQKLTLAQATHSRDALAKAIYSNLFDWLVGRINNSLEVGKILTGRSISILDIYGFESFQKNSFEQLCINYANERLQQHFNRHLFKLEQEEYTSENIDWTRVEFEDNQECLELIEKRPLGVISLLDEECMFPRATDFTLANKLKDHLRRNSSFKGERDKKFRICHYAGEVIYETDGFLEKNRDLLHADLVELLGSCDCALTRQFTVSNVQGSQRVNGSESQKHSVATKFKGQLNKLMQRLEATEPHFIRCIKPNTQQLPNVVDQKLVVQQLKCCGVLEVVRISRAGYPTRYTHVEFANRYGFLLPRVLSDHEDVLSICVAVFDHFAIAPEMYQVGITKLFFRTGQIGMLEDVRVRTLQGVARAQAVYKGYKVRLAYKKTRKTIIFLQCMVRAAVARKRFADIRARYGAAVVIQKHVRRWCARRAFQIKKKHVVKIQSVVRMWLAKRQLCALQKEFEEKIAAEAKSAAEAEEKRAAEAKLAAEAEEKRAAEAKLAAEAEEKREAQAKRAAEVIFQAEARSSPEVEGTGMSDEVQESIKDIYETATMKVLNTPFAEFETPSTEKEATIRVRPSYILELQQRAVMAEKALREKEEDNILLRQKLQHYDQQSADYKAKMSSMEEMWQKQMATLQLSLEAAKKSMAPDESALQTSPKESSVDPRAISAKHSRGSRPLLQGDEEECEWDDEAASASGKSPLQNSSKFSQAGSEYASSQGEVAAGRSYVSQMVREYDHRRQVFTDDVDFLVEVKSGQTLAHLNPEEELRKLKAKFDGWKKDFKVRLRETKVVLSKLGNAETTMEREKEKTRKKWWSKRLPP